MTEEPKIIINGRTLTRGEAMTVRVAIEALAGDVNAMVNAEDTDGVGKDIANGYKRAINCIRSYMGLW